MQVKHGHVIFQIGLQKWYDQLFIINDSPTGGATNLQQVQFGTFEYTESAVTSEIR